MIRLADGSGHYLQHIRSVNTYQPYEKSQDYKSETLPFFAEQYFRDKLKANPDDLVSEFMLVEIYLHNEKSFEARKILDHIRQQAPKSSYASLKLIQAYKIDNNKTDLTKEQEFLKKTDPDNYQSLLLSWGDAIQKEDYTAAEQIYRKLTGMYGENEAISLLRLAV
jgi:cytochrome c-type biogenesis protein CcmH/NrfG